jgi:hypothetical protein
MKTKDKLFRLIAKNCEWHKTVKGHYINVCEGNINRLKDYLPHGSGFDNGCKIDIERSGKSKVVILFSFHHMDENGYYCGWTDHELIITPCLVNEFNLRITGKDQNYIKEYLYETFDDCLNQVVEI